MPKHGRRVSGFDEAVISLCAKGLTTGEIRDHLAELYGADVSRKTISKLTDAVAAELAEWQSMDRVYAVVVIDCIRRRDPRWPGRLTPDRRRWRHRSRRCP